MHKLESPYCSLFKSGRFCFRFACCRSRHPDRFHAGQKSKMQKICVRVLAALLSNPLVITIAAHENERQRIGLGDVTLEKDRFVVAAIGAIGPIGSGQGRVVGNGARHGVQNVLDFLFAFVPVHERLVGRRLVVFAQLARVLQRFGALVFLRVQHAAVVGTKTHQDQFVAPDGRVVAAHVENILLFFFFLFSEQISHRCVVFRIPKKILAGNGFETCIIRNRCTGLDYERLSKP
jgi:hypothetical protein